MREPFFSKSKPGNARRCGLAAAFGIVLAFTLPTSDVRADNCLDRVQALAARYNVVTDPPTVAPKEVRKPLNSEELGKSGGVIEPPPTPDRSVIPPPRSAESNMPTLPDVVPPSPKGAGANSLDAAQMSSLEALLVAARAQGERGMESECLDGLRKAQEVIERRP